MGTLNEMRIRRFTLRLPTLPREFDGMTIAQVSDLHIGRFLHPDRLPQIREQVNALDADFIAFTGDLIDLSLEDLPAGIDFLHRLKVRHGMAICEGNHDLVENRGAFERAMKEAGLPLLISEAMTLPFRGRKLQFLALPWNGYDAAHFEAMKFVKPLVDPDAFPILLAHHPHGFDAAAQAGLPLTLSGHTHGGQLMLNEKLGAGAVRFRYISGLYQKAQSSLLVCNGIGNWFPLRINAPAEILHITLRAM
jgi:predicted MPP superfamily phosphohydrolase